ncbi:MAG TPA: hypothetical protein PKN72_06335, partial [Nitrosomonas europaea]|nr:hypothetical protein [Nitrosomonas europaea]
RKSIYNPGNGDKGYLFRILLLLLSVRKNPGDTLSSDRLDRGLAFFICAHRMQGAPKRFYGFVIGIDTKQILVLMMR